MKNPSVFIVYETQLGEPGHIVGIFTSRTKAYNTLVEIYGGDLERNDLEITEVPLNSVIDGGLHGK